MTTHTESSHPVEPQARPSGRLAGGLILILVGALLLAQQWLDLSWTGLYIPALLGVIFLAWGIATRQGGLLIPGGILCGIGLGAYLTNGPLAELQGQAQGGVFLLAFAAGWGLITLTSAVFTPRVMGWPLIPGGILALIGAGLLAGEPGLRLLEWAGRLWPVVLIAIGLGILLRRGQR